MHRFVLGKKKIWGTLSPQITVISYTVYTGEMEKSIKNNLVVLDIVNFGSAVAESRVWPTFHFPKVIPYMHPAVYVLLKCPWVRHESSADLAAVLLCSYRLGRIVIIHIRCRHISQITVSVKLISNKWDVETYGMRLIKSNRPLTNDRDTDQNRGNNVCDQTEALEDILLWSTRTETKAMVCLSAYDQYRA